MKTEPQINLGEQLRTVFREGGLSIKQLSDRSDVPYASVHGLITANRHRRKKLTDRLTEMLTYTECIGPGTIRIGLHRTDGDSNRPS